MQREIYNSTILIWFFHHFVDTTRMLREPLACGRYTNSASYKSKYELSVIESDQHFFCFFFFSNRDQSFPLSLFLTYSSIFFNTQTCRDQSPICLLFTHTKRLSGVYVVLSMVSRCRSRCRIHVTYESKRQMLHYVTYSIK